MRTVYLQPIDKKLFEDFLIKDGYIEEMNKEGEIIEIQKSENDLFEIKYDKVYSLFPISLYILGNVLIDLYSTEKDRKMINQIQERILTSNYFTSIISLELDRYFASRDKLFEEKFLKFNLNGLNEEIKLIKETIIIERETEAIKDKLYDSYAKKGIKVKEFEEVRVEYIQGELNIISKGNDKINLDNVEEKLGLELEVDAEDNWIVDLYLCLMVCTILKVKKITIPIEYEDLYNELSINESLIETGIEIILK